MEQKIGDSNTLLFLEVDEAKEICKLGEGSACCPFLVMEADGFVCWKMNYPDNGVIHTKINEGTMNAKGDGCDDAKWKSLCDSCTGSG